jgi:hypothetical protein
MFRSWAARWAFGTLAVIAVLGLLRFKPWQRGSGTLAGRASEARQRLSVGFLPVT